MKPLFLAVAVSVVAFASQAAEPVERASTNAAAANGPVIVVELRELGTDRPVPGIKLGCAFGGREPIIPGVTDAAGQFQLPVPAGEVRSLLVETVASDGWVPMQWYWSRRQATEPVPEQVAMVMEKAAVFSGQVVDDAGTPVSGATVRVYAAKRYSDRQGAKLMRLSVQSKADGQWTCGFVPATAERIELSVFHPRYVNDPAKAQKERFESVAALRASPVTLRLERGVVLEGVVTGPDGQPIWKALVVYGPKRTPATGLPEQRTDKQGRFACGAKPGDTAVITIKAPGCAPELKKFVVTEKPEPVIFQMVAGKELTGRVVDEQGQPVSGASVYVDAWRGYPVLSVSLRTDAEGRFLWTEAPADAVTGRVFKSGGGGTQKVTLQAGEKNEITLLGPTVVTGTVVDEETGQPVPEFRFLTGIRSEDDRPIQWVRRSGVGGQPPEGRAGKFEITLSSDSRACALRIEAEGYLAEDSAPFVLDGKTKTLAFRVSKRELIRGVVRSLTGDPVAGVQVIVVTATSELQTENGRVPEFLLRNAAHTLSTTGGLFRLPAQPDAVGLLALHDTGYATVAGMTNSAVTLTPWGTIQGVAKTGNKPAARQPLGLVYVNRVTPDAFHNVETDEKGSFRFERVMAGEASIVTSDKTGAVNRPLAKLKVESGQTAAINIKTD